MSDGGGDCQVGRPAQITDAIVSCSGGNISKLKPADGLKMINSKAGARGFRLSSEK